MNQTKNPRARYAASAALALAIGLAGAAAASGDRSRHADRRTDPAAPPSLTMEQVLAQLRSAGFSDFREIERKNGHFEVEGRNGAGDRVELHVDAGNGRIVKEERDD